MVNQNFTLTITLDQSPAEVFKAVTNVRGWWCNNLTGETAKAEAEFEVRFADIHYSRQKVTNIIPEKKIEWLVTDSYLSFLANKNEWTGTTISFDITTNAAQTQMTFTHLGLTNNIECYEACSNAWTDYLQNSLLKLITTGKGEPYKKETEPSSSVNQ